MRGGDLVALCSVRVSGSAGASHSAGHTSWPHLAGQCVSFGLPQILKCARWIQLVLDEPVCDEPLPFASEVALDSFFFIAGAALGESEAAADATAVDAESVFASLLDASALAGAGEL